MTSSPSRSVAVWPLAVLFICSVLGLDYRLDGSVVPSHYNLTIGVLRDSSDPTLFDGEVSITVRGVGPTPIQNITLHADTLEILSCRLVDVGGGPTGGSQVEALDISRMIYEAATQQVTVPLTQPLEAGRDYALEFKYTGRIRSDMAGLFSASYVEAETNATRWLALTQMQRINARYVFPCFDEPALKAKFQLQIDRPNGYQAIANTKVTKTTPSGSDRFIDSFAETPAMSTYLLAFMIASYTARGNTSDFSVLSRPEFYKNTEFSYEVGQKVIQAYNELFALPYAELGNEVLQYASSPRFPHNGMENWGLIIYSDDVLVRIPDYTDDWSDKEFAIRIIAHETSHMWFGDSVTFSWWSYFWLNEAFARYYEYFMAHQLYPEYHLDEQFVVRQMQLIFATDAKNSTQPMTSPESEIQTPSQIASKFSAIAYAKGACIVRMWRNCMGEENFNAAIRDYLRQYQSFNTEPRNLFFYLYANWPANQVTLEDFFADYTEQVGYPMLIVNVSPQKHIVYIEQMRFLLSPGDGSNATLKYTVPITYATNLDPNFENLTPSSYLNKVVDVLQLEFDDPIDWIVLNLRQSNYQRVLYDTTLMANLQVALSARNHSGIPVENRAQMIDDFFNFARVGYLDYSEVFEFLEYLSSEVHYVPWYAFFENLQLVAKRLTPEQLPSFRSYLEDNAEAVFEKLGVDWNKAEDTPLDVANRNKVVAWLCRYQARECRDQIHHMITASEPKKPTPDYRQTFYCAGSSQFSGLMQVWKLFLAETRPSEKQLLWTAMSCTRDYETHYYKFILENATTVEMKKVGIATLYEENPDSVEPIFKMITANITELALSLNSWSDTAEVISDMAEYFTTREQQQLFKDFYQNSQQLFGQSATVLSKSLDSVEANLQWAEQRLGRLVNFLAKRNRSSSVQATSLLLLLLASLALIAVSY